MGHLNEVVQFGPLFDKGDPKSGPVHGGIGPYFDFVFDFHVAKMGNFKVFFSVKSKPKTIGPDHSPGVNDHPLAYPGAGVKDRVWVDDTFPADKDLFPYKDPGVQDHPGLNPGPFAHVHEG